MDLESRMRLLEQENESLRAENQAKSDFLSIIVHQLRTPLAATKWIFKMMMDGDFGGMSDEQRTIIGKGFQSNEQMIRMLSEVSETNHLSEWRLQVHPAPTDLAPCIADALAEFTEEARSRNVSLAFARPESLPRVMADREKICLVLENLVENAIKYNRPGGSVTVRTETFRDSLVVSVTDTGIGIPLDEQPHLFGKFYRAENAKKAERGTGLGLFVVKQLVEANHGSVWLESTENVGSTFFFALPLAK